MAWCWQAASHYLSQCWPIFLWPYDISRPQWVKGWMSEIILHCCNPVILLFDSYDMFSFSLRSMAMSLIGDSAIEVQIQSHAVICHYITENICIYHHSTIGVPHTEFCSDLCVTFGWKQKFPFNLKFQWESWVKWVSLHLKCHEGAKPN